VNDLETLLQALQPCLQLPCHYQSFSHPVMLSRNVHVFTKIPMQRKETHGESHRDKNIDRDKESTKSTIALQYYNTIQKSNFARIATIKMMQKNQFVSKRSTSHISFSAPTSSCCYCRYCCTEGPCHSHPNATPPTISFKNSSTFLKKLFPIYAKKRQKEKLASSQSFFQRRETKT
jgi:hypothetical protein